MKDIIYAGFAQLSYLNWHNLEKKFQGNKLKSIFDSMPAFNQIKTPDYDAMETDGTDCYVKKTEDGKKIYDSKDARAFYLYSENEGNPNENPMYPEFGDWQFICAYNHKKILNEMKKEADREAAIGAFDSGFQASAFNKGNDVIIVYRGSDDKTVWEHILGDWIFTNGALGIQAIPDSLTCAVWFYHKVIETTRVICDIIPKDFKSVVNQPNYHITGHSMGGALAQYVAVYSNGKHQTVTWNALGIGDKNKGVINFSKFKHYEKYFENYPWLLFNKHVTNSIKNYYISSDLTPNLQKRVGKIISVDKKTNYQIDYGGSNLLRKVFMGTTKNLGDYHSVRNFMPFFHGSEIKVEELNENFIQNSIKTELLENNQLKLLVEKEKILKKEQLKFEISTLKAYKTKLKYSLIKNKLCFDIVEERESKQITLYSEILRSKISSYQKFLCKKEQNTLNFGKFNNMETISGAVGGITYEIQLAPEVKNSTTFKEILNIILPSINNEKIELICDSEALDFHQISYNRNRIINGSVLIKIEKKEYKNNYSLKPSNKFGAKFIEDGITHIHMGCDFSYGRENTFCCTHPPVYSPVKGEIVEAKNGRVTVKNTENKKTLCGKVVEIPYYHRIEHLHELKVKIGQKIDRGNAIGTMGGQDYHRGNKYKYFQHVHYEIMMNNRYYTGSVKTKSDKKALEPKSFDRLIDPEIFWDKGLEVGLSDFIPKKIGGIQE